MVSSPALGYVLRASSSARRLDAVGNPCKCPRSRTSAFCSRSSRAARSSRGTGSARRGRGPRARKPRAGNLGDAAEGSVRRRRLRRVRRPVDAALAPAAAQAGRGGAGRSGVLLLHGHDPVGDEREVDGTIGSGGTVGGSSSVEEGVFIGRALRRSPSPRRLCTLGSGTRRGDRGAGRRLAVRDWSLGPSFALFAAMRGVRDARRVLDPVRRDGSLSGVFARRVVRVGVHPALHARRKREPRRSRGAPRRRPRRRVSAHSAQRPLELGTELGAFAAGVLVGGGGEDGARMVIYTEENTAAKASQNSGFFFGGEGARVVVPSDYSRVGRSGSGRADRRGSEAVRGAPAHLRGRRVPPGVRA